MMPRRCCPGGRAFRFDLDVDICVVGAGLAGLTVALEAASSARASPFSKAGMSAGTHPAIISAR